MGMKMELNIIGKRHIMKCYSLYLLATVLSIGVAFSQSKKDWVNMKRYYEPELTKRLQPQIDTLQGKQVLLYIAKPSFVDPEHSIRLIDNCNQSFLEAHILERNLWDELTNMSKKGDTIISIKTHSISIPVSQKFKNKMLKIFSEVIKLNESRKRPNGPITFDGTLCEFVIFENGGTTSTVDYNLEKKEFDYKVSVVNLQIINDMRNGTFKESNYYVYK